MGTPLLLWSLLYAALWMRVFFHDIENHQQRRAVEVRVGGNHPVSGVSGSEESRRHSDGRSSSENNISGESNVVKILNRFMSKGPNQNSENVNSESQNDNQNNEDKSSTTRLDIPSYIAPFAYAQNPLVPLSDLQCDGWPGYNITCKTRNAYFIRDRVVLLGVEGLGSALAWRNVELGDYSINLPEPGPPKGKRMKRGRRLSSLTRDRPAVGEMWLPDHLRRGVLAVHGIPNQGTSSARKYDYMGVSFDDHWGLSRRGLLVEKKIFRNTTVLNEWVKRNLKIVVEEDKKGEESGGQRKLQQDEKDEKLTIKNPNPTPNNPNRFYYPGTTLFFGAFWHNSIGHGLVDGLYPSYVSLVKFGLENEPVRGFFADALQCTRPALMTNCDTMVCGIKPADYCATEEAFDRFLRMKSSSEDGKDENDITAAPHGVPGHFFPIVSTKMIARVNDRFHEDLTIGLFETMMFGSGSASAYSCTIGSLPYAHPLASDAGFLKRGRGSDEEGVEQDIDIPRLFRDRMYQAHGVVPRKIPSDTDNSKEIPRTPRRIMVLDNKRFLPELREEISGLVNLTQHSDDVIIEFAQWGTRMGSGGMTLEQQLKKFAELDVFVTGPGTATYNAMWVPDGAAIVLTGHQIPKGFFFEQSGAVQGQRQNVENGKHEDDDEDDNAPEVVPAAKMKPDYNRTFHYEHGGTADCLGGDNRYDNYKVYLEGSKLGFSLTYVKFYFMPLEKIDVWKGDDLLSICKTAAYEAPKLYLQSSVEKGLGPSFDVYENLSPFGKLEVDFWRVSENFRKGQLPAPHGHAKPADTQRCHGASGPSQCQSERMFWELGADYCGYEKDLKLLRELRAKSGIMGRLGITQLGGDFSAEEGEYLCGVGGGG